jgi:multisubunit Na+/H+ antiporter MnhG subunit
MQLDIRTPMALMFAILGAILTVLGIVKMNDAATLEKSLGTNINLWWGIVMIIFAAVMFAWSRSGKNETK